MSKSSYHAILQIVLPSIRPAATNHRCDHNTNKQIITTDKQQQSDYATPTTTPPTTTPPTTSNTTVDIDDGGLFVYSKIVTTSTNSNVGSSSGSSSSSGDIPYYTLVTIATDQQQPHSRMPTDSSWHTHSQLLLHSSLVVPASCTPNAHTATRTSLTADHCGARNEDAGVRGSSGSSSGTITTTRSSSSCTRDSCFKHRGSGCLLYNNNNI
eukprot:GHVS01082485.1.p1 GENE.GHVS01082485.1~~GHVS01082485.1.p1  ORF type:complete len:211 (+),score=81.91 GHVS01082485.1:167-799(+)